MKKTLSLASVALIAFAAQAQYTVNPSTATVLENNDVEYVDYIILSDGAIADFTQAGAKLSYIGPNPDEGRNLWYWNGFNPGDESMPRVDMEEGGYTSVEIQAGVDWSGAGFAIDVPGVDLSHLTDDSHFHMAYMSPSGNGPASIGVILLNKDDQGSIPAKFAIGGNFDDNGVIYPSIAPKINDDWQGIDITLGDLRKLCPTFRIANANAWIGNVMSWIAGNVAGQTMAFDAMYFYTPKNDENAVETVESENINFVITDKTVNVNGANGIEIYALDGALVKATATSVLGIEDLNKGVYVVRCGAKAIKVVIR